MCAPLTGVCTTTCKKAIHIRRLLYWIRYLPPGWAPRNARLLQKSEAFVSQSHHNAVSLARIPDKDPLRSAKSWEDTFTLSDWRGTPVCARVAQISCPHPEDRLGGRTVRQGAQLSLSFITPRVGYEHSYRGRQCGFNTKHQSTKGIGGWGLGFWVSGLGLGASGFRVGLGFRVRFHRRCGIYGTTCPHLWHRTTTVFLRARHWSHWPGR